ncbi:ferric reductase-like transmembrane domain-containing protein [uncultured Pelagimonas sp.]|uniref:ferric reductase-like transmembrane domain-containing protein n=1 Tax=uncultured Pelagimonas sp. TaxID=1618102 RepID=UPI0026147FD0|nr:ferric reductase-like transmembrane domain-containing protein [uncultured Pelagimonas sp.]
MKSNGLIKWGALAVAIVLPLVFAARSPLLEWRDPIYILAGFAGVIGLALLLVQPLLIAGTLPGVPSQKTHTWTGFALILAVIIHVAGLWITSPPDVVDVLLFRSPTPFSIWGALAMWAVFAAGLLAIARRKLSQRRWRIAHTLAAATTIIGTVVHAWYVQGTMEVLSKGMLCLLVIGASVWALRRRRAWRLFSRSKGPAARNSSDQF